MKKHIDKSVEYRRALELEAMFYDDQERIINELKENYGVDCRLTGYSISYLPEGYDDEDIYWDDDMYEDDEDTYIIEATFSINDVSVPFTFQYLYDDQGWASLEFTTKEIYDRYKFYAGDGEDVIESSQQINILAAEGDDPFDDMDFDDPELEDETDNDSLEDSIEDMSDTLDDMNDALNDLEEDPIDIETHNDIENHMIAECEKCHGVFITSIIESDQEIEKVSGKCPLCDEECDQYIKWVIKEI